MRKILSSLFVAAVMAFFLYSLDLNWSIFFSGDISAAKLELASKVQHAGLWKYPLFILLFTVPPLFLVPMTLLSLVTALLFESEPLAAAALLVGGFLSNTAFSFYLARSLGQEAVEKYFFKDSAMLKRMDRDSENWGIAVVMLWRFLPVPYAWPALAAGLSRMPLVTLLVGTSLVSCFWAWFYVSFSASILRGDKQLLLTATGVFAVLMTAGWLLRRAKAASDETEESQAVFEKTPAFPLRPQEPVKGPTLELLSIPGDKACEEARLEMLTLSTKLGFEILEKDVRDDLELEKRYGDQVPVVLLEGVQLFSYQVDAHTIQVRLKEKAQGKVWTGGSTWAGSHGETH